jgi:hypothetical protein
LTGVRKNARLSLREIIVRDAAVGQSQIGDEAMHGDGPAHGDVGDRRVDTWDEMQPPGPDPGALHRDVGQIIGDRLANAGLAVDAAGAPSTPSP